MSFADLGLIPELLQGRHTKPATPSPRRSSAQAIPIVHRRGKDVMGGAQTGTGKTAGFTLPMLHRTRPPRQHLAPRLPAIRYACADPGTHARTGHAGPRKSVKTYSKHLPLRSVCVYGGVDIRPQH
jgi:ATP-dependent RNA helicase RhlE